MAVSIALPKGRLLRKTAALLQKAGWEINEYHAKSSFYRPASATYPELILRVFNEKDIPIQIAMGNYDLGICCLDWIEELLVKYPNSQLVKVRDLGYGEGTLYTAGSIDKNELWRCNDNKSVRIASEYPHLAESWALRKRLERFNVFSLWGAAEAYPPENAEAILLSTDDPSVLADYGLTWYEKELSYSAHLIANRHAWETKRLDTIVQSLSSSITESRKTTVKKASAGTLTAPKPSKQKIGNVRLALPDGHQQEQTVAFFNKAGIQLSGYPSESGERRPGINVEGIAVKVIRPQDMPLQVANGNFDIAITGRDWLIELKRQFPTSPVTELLDLKLRRVRIVAVVPNDMEAESTDEIRRWAASRQEPVRVASEYVNIADAYARDNRFGNYRIIPTFGASEAFLPDDADILIENTETGRTIRLHNLKIIETIFESTAILIGNETAINEPGKQAIIRELVARLEPAVEPDR